MQLGEYAVDAVGKCLLGWDGPDYTPDFNESTISHFAIHAGAPRATPHRASTARPHVQALALARACVRTDAHRSVACPAHGIISAGSLCYQLGAQQLTL